MRAWMDDMAAEDLALSTMRSRQSTLSGLCTWLVKREIVRENPVARLDRPRYERTPPTAGEHRPYKGPD
jgi:site-specific recombinase XerC